jgi:fructose/tagatose bisphosphate aldolase
MAKSDATNTGVTYGTLPAPATAISSLLGDGIVFGLHMDHYAVKSPADRDQAMRAIPAAVARGWTSVAIDASHNPDWENLSFTRDVALSIPPFIGLEAEVGEIRGGDVLTTVPEAEYFVGGLNSWGVFLISWPSATAPSTAPTTAPLVKARA